MRTLLALTTTPRKRGSGLARSATYIAAILAGVVLLGGACWAEGKPRLILAPVMDVSSPEGGKQKAEGIADAVRTGLKEALFKSGKFVLVADTDIQKDLDSQKYQQYLSGDFNPAMAAAIGQKVGAKSLVKCSVTMNQLASKTKDLILVKETEYTMQLAVSIEICDIEQAIICFMHTATAEQSSKSKSLDLGSNGAEKPISLSNPKDVRVMAINQVVQELAAKVIENAVKEKGKGTVTSVKGSGQANDAIVVGIGSNGGAASDMEIAILGVDEDGFEEAIGKAKVTAVQEDKCKAVILSTNRAVVVGDMVQLASAGGSTSGGGSTTPDSGGASAARQRVMVVVPETHLKLVVPDPAGETQIIKRLTESNFIVVDQKVSKEIADNDSLRAKIKGNAEEVLRYITDRSDAEIIIMGEAFSEGVERLTTASGPAFKCGARIEVRAVQRDNGRILYADGVHALSVDATEALAGKRALKSAAELLCSGHDGAKGFVEMVKDRLLNPVQIVECVISGLGSEDDLQIVEDGLKAACGGTVHRYAYRDGTAKFNIESNKTAQELTDAVKASSLKGKIKLAGTTPNKIEYEFVN